MTTMLKERLDIPSLHDHHDHEAPERLPRPIVSRALGACAIIGNGLVGMAEWATSSLRNIAHWSDAFHNVVDAGTYGLQALNVRLGHKLPHRMSHKLDKLSTNAIFASSLGGIGLGLYHSGETFVGDARAEFHGHSLSTALASAALTGTVAAWTLPRARKKGFENLSGPERAWVDHLKIDAVSSGLAVAGSLPGNTAMTVAATGIAASAYAVTKFNPWTEHNCPHSHEHEHHHEHDHHDHAPAVPPLHVSDLMDYQSWRLEHGGQAKHRKEKKPSRIKRLLGIGAAAATITTGATLVSAANSTHEQLPSPGTGEAPAPVLDTECHIVEPGDSQWSVSAERLIDAMGYTPTEAVIHQVTEFTIGQNRATTPDPHIIHPGDCLQVPTFATLQTISTTS